MRSRMLYALSIAVAFTGAAICFAGHMLPGFLVGLAGAIGAHICANGSDDRPPRASEHEHEHREKQ